MSKKSKESFEEKMMRIQEIVEILDAGEKPLEEMITFYEEGMKLSQECRNFLEKAENKIIDITNNYSNSSELQEEYDEEFE
jgi:exodeoxyribonuclease VII small subunit